MFRVSFAFHATAIGVSTSQVHAALNSVSAQCLRRYMTIRCSSWSPLAKPLPGAHFSRLLVPSGKHPHGPQQCISSGRPADLG